jgi:hypothetical protein
VIPLDPTAVLAVVCACVFCAGGGYLLGYLEGRQHREQEDVDRDRDGNWRY